MADSQWVQVECSLAEAVTEAAEAGAEEAQEAGSVVLVEEASVEVDPVEVGDEQVLIIQRFEDLKI